MLKKALATAGLTAVALGASAGFASAAPADEKADLPDVVDICNAPTQDNPEQKDSYAGILKKGDIPNQIIGALVPGTAIVGGICQSEDVKPDEGGDQGQDQGGDQGTPVPAPAPGGDGPGNSDGIPGGGNDNTDGGNGGGDTPFPAPSLA